MLHKVKPNSPILQSDPYRPAFIEPLISAVASNGSTTDAMQSIIRKFGFETFLYAMATAPHLDVESQIYFWTNQPREWIALYDESSYVEIDPRQALSENQVTPFVWDTTSVSKTPKFAAFLSVAARFGICSGIVIPIPDPHLGRVDLAMNSPVPDLNDARRSEIRDSLGNLMLLGAHVHQMFMHNIVDRAIPPVHMGSPLSPREIQCLSMAAQGLSGGDIARRLQLSERTIHFHFSNVNSKLGAANRAEAVALALHRQLLTL